MPESVINIKRQIKKINPTDDVLSPPPGCYNCGANPMVIYYAGDNPVCTDCNAIQPKIH